MGLVSHHHTATLHISLASFQKSQAPKARTHKHRRLILPFAIKMRREKRIGVECVQEARDGVVEERRLVSSWMVSDGYH